MTLVERELDFLVRLSIGRQLRLADRQEDRIRQKMRKAGYAKVVMSPRRWVITDAGQAALIEFRLEDLRIRDLPDVGERGDGK